MRLGSRINGAGGVAERTAGAGSPPAGTECLRRDRLTRVSYGALGAYAFWLYAFGPALALMRVELHFSYGLIGVYSALWAAGAAVSGVSFVGLARRLGRARLLWAAAMATAAGAGLFVTNVVVLTLLGALVMGFAGTLVQVLTQSVLSDRHGPRTPQALIESNIGAGACAVVAPLALGVLADTPPGWRVAMALPALALAGLYLAYRHESLTSTPPAGENTTPSRRLPLAAWLLAALVAVGIAVEFCVVYFGTELLTNTGLAPSVAATVMSGFYLGILAGRIAGAWLSHRPGRAPTLLWVSMALTTAGFVVFWLSGHPIPAVAGLFVCGVGTANLFPLSLALTLAAAGGQGDTANARAQLLGGIVVIVAPLLLGALADRVGLIIAFAVEPFLLALSGLLLLAGTHWKGRASPAFATSHRGVT